MVWFQKAVLVYRLEILKISEERLHVFRFLPLSGP